MSSSPYERDIAKILARAQEISAGSTLRFGLIELQQALEAYLEMWHLRWQCHGEPYTYVKLHGVTTSYGSPVCSQCNMTFGNNSSYARHILGYKHQIKPTSREAVDEVRAHLQAFPMPREIFASRDRLTTVRLYEFRNVPGEGDEEESVESPAPTIADTSASDEVDGPWHAYLEDDEENNSCIYLQDGDDRENRELFEMVEHDVRDSMPGQDTDYLRAAEEEARDRNRSESAD